jgi:hypothetical protein
MNPNHSKRLSVCMLFAPTLFAAAAAAQPALRAEAGGPRHASAAGPEDAGTRSGASSALEVIPGVRHALDTSGLFVTPSDEQSGWWLRLGTRGWGRGGRAQPAAAGTMIVNGPRSELDCGPIREWFEERRDGIEHGWTVSSPPQGDASGPLVIELRIEGPLTARIDADGSGASFHTPLGTCVLLYSGLCAWDAAGKPLAANLRATPWGLCVFVEDAHASYPITVDPILSGPVWSAESNQAGAQSGRSVASAGDVNGDGYTEILVGIPKWDQGAPDVGRVDLHYGSASGPSASPGWSFVGPEASADVGTCVRGVGDLNGDGFGDVAVGAPFADGPGGSPNHGRVYVFLGSASGLSSTPSVVLTGPSPEAWFGWSLAGAGDVSGDGRGDLIVGAPSRSNGELQEGTLYLFLGTAGGISTTPAWSYESNQSMAQLGWSVDQAGDIDADGFNDVVAGAPRWTSTLSLQGAALVFRGGPAGLGATPSTTLLGVFAGAQFGTSVARAGDCDGDGHGDLLVGAPGTSNPQPLEGAAYLFRGTAAGVALLPAWTHEGNQINAQAGASVSCAGDVNGDGLADVVIGSPYWDAAQLDAGRAALFLGTPTGLSSSAAWQHEGSAAGELVGLSVCGAGDVGGDGFADVLAGAPGHSAGQPEEGAVRLFRGAAGPIGSFPIWAELSSQVGAEYGVSTAWVGDLDGDGFTDFAVGAFLHDTPNGANSGIVYVYRGGDLGSAPQLLGTIDGPHAGAEFGNWVSAAGDVNGDGRDDFLVGARAGANGQAGEGLVFVFHGSASGFTPTPALVLESNQGGAGLGQCVAAAGDVNGDGIGDVIVGAHLWDGTAPDVGRAWVHLGSPTGLQPTPAWSVQGSTGGEQFGSNVASAGDVDGDGYSDVIVSSFAAGGTGTATAYVFRGSASGLSTAPAWSFGVPGPNGRITSVAGVGDVNGDGFSEIAVGSPLFDGAFQDEGRVFVFYGGPAGPSPAPSWTASGGQAGARFGVNVSSAGDVDADGLSDLLVSAPLYDGGQQDEGAVFVFLGSATGLASSPGWIGQVDQDAAFLGVSCTGAGDVNGDGFSDVLAGGLGYTFTQQNQGSAHLFLGNGAVRGGSPVGVRQVEVDGTSPIALGGATDTVQFRIRARAHGSLGTAAAPFGRSRARLEWQVRPAAAPFAATPVQAGAWAGSSPIGATLGVEGLVQGVPGGQDVWRARLAWGDPLFPHGPWLVLPGNALTELDLRSAPDCNGNGIADTAELPGHDCDGDGRLDACEILDGEPDLFGVGPGGAVTCVGNGVPDACESAADCDSDTIPDACEIQAGASDCDLNGVPDSCQIAGHDCNANGILDSCDINGGVSLDSNADGVPDECQTQVSTYCFGDGTGSACPCGNVSVVGHGCPNSENPQGSLLVTSGVPSRGHDNFRLHGSGMTPGSPVLYFQGTATQNGTLGSVFGDGLRCAAGTIVRLGTTVNSAGASSFPPAGSSIGALGLIPVGGGVIRFYQGWYRDASAIFCTTSRFNLTNGVAAVWVQ